MRGTTFGDPMTYSGLSLGGSAGGSHAAHRSS